MIVKLIKKRSNLLGITNAELAKIAETSPSQISAFLKEKEHVSLSHRSLEKLFDALDIDLSVYDRRVNCALRVAETLREKGFTLEQAKDLSMLDLKKVLDNDDSEVIDTLWDCGEKMYHQLLSKESLVSVECTYPFFLSMVLHLMGAKQRFTPKMVKTSLLAVAAALGMLPIPFLGPFAMAELFSDKSKVENEKDFHFTKALINLSKHIINL